jgi:hypothetical protein
VIVARNILTLANSIPWVANGETQTDQEAGLEFPMNDFILKFSNFLQLNNPSCACSSPYTSKEIDMKEINLGIKIYAWPFLENISK